MAELLVIVPSRGRPRSLIRVADAWYATGAFEGHANLIFAVDADDPALPRYRKALTEVTRGRSRKHVIELVNAGPWRPMVPKLNRTALLFADRVQALAFMGDDHLPRTGGWVRRYLDELRRLRVGIVYGNDLVHGGSLPTQWAMSSDIVRRLGRMVPAAVGHLYCDNAILALGLRADCIRYLPTVVVEHVHPVVGKSNLDAGYRRVNAPGQHRRDSIAYRRWLRNGLARDAAVVRSMREGWPEK